MALKSGGRKLSFDVLTWTEENDDISTSFNRSISDPSVLRNGVVLNDHPTSKKKRNRKKKNKKLSEKNSVIFENSVLDGNGDGDGDRGVNLNTNGGDENLKSNGGEISGRNFYSYSAVTSSTVTVCEEVAPVKEPEGSESNYTVGAVNGELRQRNVNVMKGGSEDVRQTVSFQVEEDFKKKEESSETESSNVNNQRSEMNGRKLEKEESLDWKKLMAENLHHAYPVEKSPVKYLMDDMYTGHSLSSTVTLGNEKERERVYDTIFRLPWRCELLIDVGFFVCMDSFLSLLTIMPMRMVLTLWKIVKARQFKRPSAAELSDFGCFLVLVSGVTLLQQTDISLIYHMIRGQGIIKLYVVYNVLEIFDKLFQSFGGDVMQTLFNSADGLANCSPENLQYWVWRFISDEALAIASSIVHSFILLAQAITLSTCIVAHNNALFALLVSNNFAEIKSNVFKRFSKDNIHSIVYSDSVERFHISAFLLFVLAQNILEAEGPWFENFLFNALVVYICELLIDIIKHSFIAKFNDIKPIAFSEFLEDLSKQTLNIQTDAGKRKLIFVPVAPACLVIRVLRPVYAARIPYNPLPWRLLWIFLWTALTYVMLASLKVMISMGLKKHARWYVKRCEKRKLHTD